MKSVLVESFIPDYNEHSQNLIRLRPCPGQGYDKSMRVSWGVQNREDYPVGTVFRLLCTEVERGNKIILWSHRDWDFEVIKVGPRI